MSLTSFGIITNMDNLSMAGYIWFETFGAVKRLTAYSYCMGIEYKYPLTMSTKPSCSYPLAVYEKIPYYFLC